MSTQVRSGYQQTEIGVFPDDWDISAIESVTPRGIRNGIVDGPFGSNLKIIHYRKSGIPIVTSGYVTNGVFSADSYMYVDEFKFQAEKRSAVKPGDIVMAKIGARCGASAILPDKHPVGILSGNALKISVDQLRHSTHYIWQVLWGLYKDDRINELRTVGAQPAISMANLKKYKIPLPPLSEQRAIATALSDMDALISGLDQLITKKRGIKQAAMQQLLSGQQRLLGFSGEWEVKRLGDIFNIFAGGDFEPSNSSAVQDEKHPFPIFSNSVSNAGLYGFCSDSIYPENSITVTARGTVGFANYRDAPYTAIGRVLVLQPKFEINCPFYTEFINSKISFVVESTGVPQLTAPQISKYEVPIPSCVEQAAIATILSDMDSDVAMLEIRRDKARQIKEGMMQELLTGKIRIS